MKRSELSNMIKEEMSKLNESIETSLIPYVNMNGDSTNKLLEDTSSIVKGCTQLIRTISAAESLYHGRNTVNENHRKLLRKFRDDNNKMLQTLADQYMEMFKHIKNNSK